MIKLLIGGSPCTYWSIAQKNNRETEASGLGWELFLNYRIAKEKFQPDFFLYENNKSAAQAIKDQIKQELGVYDGTLFMQDTGARYIEINSALVSAQNRQRFYCHNCGEVDQPEDRGILLRDVLETGFAYRRKSTALTANRGGISVDHDISESRHTLVAEPINCTKNGKAKTISASYAYKGDGEGSLKSESFPDNPIKQTSNYVAVPMVKEPFDGICQVGAMPMPNGELSTSAGFRIYSTDAKGRYLCANGGGAGAKTGLYAIPIEHISDMPIYEVKDGMIEVKGKRYPIKLADGFYIIRKLTVTECCRLQTMPDDYCRAVSDSQAYKGLGNGWTAEVIIHILSGALKDVPRDEQIVVLSMYDGIGTGRYCLDKMGFTNVQYFAYEIDKYAMRIAKSNYPDIVELGDAFQLRNDDWSLPYDRCV